MKRKKFFGQPNITSQRWNKQIQKQIQRKSQQPPQPISHPTTWHNGPDTQTKKKIPFRLNP